MNNINAQFIDKLKNADGLFLAIENELETEQIACSIGYEEALEETQESFWHFTNDGYEGMLDAVYRNEAETADIEYDDETKTYTLKRKDDEDLKIRFFFIG